MPKRLPPFPYLVWLGWTFMLTIDALVAQSPADADADAEASAPMLRIAGSDLLQSAIEPGLEEFARSRRIQVEATFDGSLRAMDALREGRVDLALIARPDTAELDTTRFRYLDFCYHVATIVVANGNPIEEISLSEASRIFRSGAAADIRRWGQLGASGLWLNRNIQPIAIDYSDGITLELFKYACLNGDPIKQGARLLRTAEAIHMALENDASTIAVYPGVDTPPNVRKLRISVREGDEGTPAFDPSPQNIYFGDYPLRLPFYIVYDPDRRSEVVPLLRWLYSDEIAQSLRLEGLVPVPANERSQRQLTFRDSGT